MGAMRRIVMRIYHLPAFFGLLLMTTAVYAVTTEPYLPPVNYIKGFAVTSLVIIALAGALLFVANQYYEWKRHRAESDRPILNQSERDLIDERVDDRISRVQVYGPTERERHTIIIE